jgi:hypothetical protein
MKKQEKEIKTETGKEIKTETEKEIKTEVGIKILIPKNR